jgi:hypothetical protein
VTTAQATLNSDTPPSERIRIKAAPPKGIAWVGRVLKTMVLLSVMFLRDVLIIHGFLLRTLLRSSVSDAAPPVRLNIGYWNKLQFKIILLARFVTQRQFLFHSWMKRVHDDILHRLANQGLTEQDLKVKIPTFRPGEKSPEYIFKNYVRWGLPVIIKGGALETRAAKLWTVEYFKERYGKEEVHLLEMKGREHFRGTLGECIDSRGTDRQLYANFTSNIFSYNPELFDDLRCLDYRDHAGGRRAVFMGAQLFLAVHKGTGSQQHCAGNTNVFYQIQGVKKWTLVSPDYLWLMYPMLNKYGMYTASFLRHDMSPEAIERYAPLQKYCPKAEVYLEPGDILINGLWQWHAIVNVTDVTIAAATRWMFRTPFTANALFEAFPLVSISTWIARFKVLASSNPGEAILLDEMSISRVKNDDYYVDFGKAGSAKQFLRLEEWPPEYQFANQRK